MLKRIASFALVLAFVLTCALAAESPELISLVSENGFSLDGLRIWLTVPTELALKVNENLTAESILSDTFKNVAVAEGMVPADVDFTKFHNDEYNNVYVEGYKPEMADVDATMKFATQYKPEDVLLVGIGTVTEIPDQDPTVEWVPLAAQADEQGNVVITFTQEVLENVQNGTNEHVFALMKAAD